MMWWRVIGSLVIALAVWDVSSRYWPSDEDQQLQTVADRSDEDQQIINRVEPAAVNLRLVNVTLPAAPGAKTVTTMDETDPTQKQYQIAFTWPQTQVARNELHHVLHQCFGVRLAKVDDDGIVLAIERGDGMVLAQMSPYVRIYQHDVTVADRELIRRWQSLDGQIVRFYPRWIDDQLFAAIDDLVPVTDADQVRITGLMNGKYNTLLINQISVNGEPANPSIRLSPGRANSNEC